MRTQNTYILRYIRQWRQFSSILEALLSGNRHFKTMSVISISSDDENDWQDEEEEFLEKTHQLFIGQNLPQCPEYSEVKSVKILPDVETFDQPIVHDETEVVIVSEIPESPACSIPETISDELALPHENLPLSSRLQIINNPKIHLLTERLLEVLKKSDPVKTHSPTPNLESTLGESIYDIQNNQPENVTHVDESSSEDLLDNIPLSSYKTGNKNVYSRQKSVFKPREESSAIDLPGSGKKKRVNRLKRNKRKQVSSTARITRAQSRMLYSKDGVQSTNTVHYGEDQTLEDFLIYEAYQQRHDQKDVTSNEVTCKKSKRGRKKRQNKSSLHIPQNNDNTLNIPGSDEPNNPSKSGKVKDANVSQMDKQNNDTSPSNVPLNANLTNSNNVNRPSWKRTKNKSPTTEISLNIATNQGPTLQPATPETFSNKLKFTKDEHGNITGVTILPPTQNQNEINTPLNDSVPSSVQFPNATNTKTHLDLAIQNTEKSVHCNPPNEEGNNSQLNLNSMVATHQCLSQAKTKTSAPREESPVMDPPGSGKGHSSLEMTGTLTFDKVAQLKAEFIRCYNVIFDDIGHQVCMKMGDLLLLAIDEARNCKSRLAAANKVMSNQLKTTELEITLRNYKANIKQYKKPFAELFGEIFVKIMCININSDQHKALLIAMFLKIFLRISPGLSPDSLLEAKDNTIRLLPDEILRLPVVQSAFVCDETEFEHNCWLVLGFMRDIVPDFDLKLSEIDCKTEQDNSTEHSDLSENLSEPSLIQLLRSGCNVDLVGKDKFAKDSNIKEPVIEKIAIKESSSNVGCDDYSLRCSEKQNLFKEQRLSTTNDYLQSRNNPLSSEITNSNVEHTTTNTNSVLGKRSHPNLEQILSSKCLKISETQYLVTLGSLPNQNLNNPSIIIQQQNDNPLVRNTESMHHSQNVANMSKQWREQNGVEPSLDHRHNNTDIYTNSSKEMGRCYIPNGTQPRTQLTSDPYPSFLHPGYSVPNTMPHGLQPPPYNYHHRYHRVPSTSQNLITGSCPTVSNETKYNHIQHRTEQNRLRPQFPTNVTYIQFPSKVNTTSDLTCNGTSPSHKTIHGINTNAGVTINNYNITTYMPPMVTDEANISQNDNNYQYTQDSPDLLKATVQENSAKETLHYHQTQPRNQQLQNHQTHVLYKRT